MTFLIILIGILAVLLIAVILIQNPKGGCVDSTFGGSANQMFGASRSGDVLEKTTWGLAIALLVLSIIATLMINSGGAGVIDTGL